MTQELSTHGKRRKINALNTMIQTQKITSISYLYILSVLPYKDTVQNIFQLSLAIEKPIKVWQNILVLLYKGFDLCQPILIIDF